jgi:phage/plasmid-like protein (TIGR03299 family)
MAHELVFDTNGKAAVFSSGGVTPWHREGHILEGHPGYEEALQLVGFGYPMEKVPYFRKLPDGTMVESRTAYFVWRPDTKKVLGNVGSDYEVVPNAVAFSPLKPLVDEGVLKLETGGVLRDGADAWLMGRWDLTKFGPEAQEVFQGEGLLPYATVMANHSGRRGILLGSTAIRIVCQNTMLAAERDGVSRWANIQHRGDAQAKLFEAANEMFARQVERFDLIAKQYKLLMKTTITPGIFRKLVLDVVAPDPRQRRDWNPEAKMAEAVVARHERKVAEVSRLWFEGKGHTGEPTAWFALQGAVEALDFNHLLWPTRSGCYRTASLLTGELAAMKSRVTDNLVGYVSRETEFAMAG